MDVSIVPSSVFSASAWGLFSPTLLPLLALGTIPLALLALAVFLPARGELSRFLTRLAAISLLFHLRRGRSGLAFRLDGGDADLLPRRQSDSLYPRLFHVGGTLLLAVARLGVAERTLLTTRVEREFPLLLLLIHFGAVAALRLTPLRDLLLALERVTLASYVLTAVERRNRFSTYAGVQYFLLGSVPSASLLLAFALFYRHGGALTLPDLDLLRGRGNPISSRADGRASLLLTSTRFGEVETVVSAVNATDSWWQNYNLTDADEKDSVISLLPTLLAAVHPVTSATVRALVLLFVNLLFKLTAAPFQFWAPSVYGNAPLPTVAVIATTSKVRVLALLLKLLPTLLAPFPALTGPLLLGAGIRSVIVGRVGALSESLLKRFFIFSSRGHVGFRLVGAGLGTAAGTSAAIHYAGVYAPSALLGWFLLIARGRHRTHLVHLTRLGRNEPVLALLRALLAFSRAGLPPLGGFFVKLDVLTALVDSGNRALAYVLFILSVIGSFYYLRLIKVRFFDQVADEVGPDRHPAVNVDRPRDERRLGLRSALGVFLVFYLFIVNPPLLALGGERLASLR